MAFSEPKVLRGLTEPDEQGVLFKFSAFTFQIGLALVTFEQIRPFFGIQVSDYCFFLSLILFSSRPQSRLQGIRGSGVLLAGSLVLFGALLSLRNASSLSDASGPLARLFVLFGLFAPLALIHCRRIRKNLVFLASGIFVNCIIACLQAWVFPGIVTALSVNPTQDDLSSGGSERLQALTSHPNVLGLSAALAALIGIGMFFSGKKGLTRMYPVTLVFVCTVAALLSGSRTFFVAFIVGLVVFGLTQKHHRVAVGRAAVVVGLLWASLSYLAPALLSGYSERMRSSGGGFAPDEGRYVSAGLALLEIWQKPILGWGPDHLDDAGLWLNPETGELAGAHNSFLMYWHGAGLLGAVGLLTLFLMPAWKILLLLKKSVPRDSAGALRAALSCQALLFLVSNVQPILFNRFLFIPLFVIGGYAAYLTRRAADDSGAEGALQFASLAHR